MRDWYRRWTMMGRLRNYGLREWVLGFSRAYVKKWVFCSYYHSDNRRYPTDPEVANGAWHCARCLSCGGTIPKLQWFRKDD